MIDHLLEWVDDQTRHRTVICEMAMDDRILVGFIVLAIVTGILSGFYV